MEHSYGFEHVAQQSRRDKLRVSRNSDEQLSFQNSGHSGFDLDLVRIQNFNKNSILPSVMINFSRDSDIMLSQELVGDASLGSVSNYWKTSDWEMNCGNNCLGGEMLNDSTVYTLQDVVNQTAACEGRGNEPNVLPYDTTGFVSDSNPQRLALSLSSNTQFQESEESKTVKSETIGNKNYGKSLQNMMGVSMNPYRNTGPLGPFTGYATILKSSKFLKPAQLLLDEFCSSNAHKFVQPCEASPALNADDETNFSGVGSISSESHQPEYQQKKAKLLYMLDEVCRRYKQYHQQMQMVVSSFESVAGLSSSTPYISLALKTVSRHFQSLKNAISEQLKYLRKVVGEDSSSISAGTSGRKYMEQSFQKQKTGIVNIGFLESQNVWRPQRGLPERAVAILRAWLFEHFLHPYPTDTDKHMLATQTGLSRNQVRAPSTQIKMTPVSSFSWHSYNEETASAYADDTTTMAGLVEQISVTRDTTDYLWYMTDIRIDPNEGFLKSGQWPLLTIFSAGHALHVFINGQLSGTVYGSLDHPKLTFSKYVNLRPGVNKLSMLSVAVGLSNVGVHYETWNAGVLGPVTLKGLNEGTRDMSGYRWSYKVGLKGEAMNLHSVSGSSSVEWVTGSLVAQKQPLTWYKTTFNAPGGNEPLALDMSSMGKGQVWVNGQSIGRHWPAYTARGSCGKCSYAGIFTEKKCHSNCGEPSQRWYHVPRSWLKPSGNILVVFEEWGGNPHGISLVKRSTS